MAFIKTHAHMYSYRPTHATLCYNEQNSIANPDNKLKRSLLQRCTTAGRVRSETTKSGRGLSGALASLSLSCSTALSSLSSCKPWLLSSLFLKVDSFTLHANPSLERGWQFPDQACSSLSWGTPWNNDWVWDLFFFCWGEGLEADLFGN